MIEDNLENNEELNEIKKVIPISGMYQNWFLDYASYVILERAIPYIFWLHRRTKTNLFQI